MLDLICNQKDFKDIFIEGNTVNIKDTKLIVKDNKFYPTIVDNLHGDSKLKFTQWVWKTYGNETKFIRHLLTNKKVTLANYQFITRRKDYSIEVYYQKSENNRELIKISSSSDIKFEDKIVHFVKYYLSDPYYLSMSSQKAKKEIMSHILSKQFDQDIEIAKWTNNPQIYTHAFIDLNELIGNNARETPAWDSFTKQFELKDEIDAFMFFIYSIFDCSNMSRQLLWLQGEGDSGKSKVINCIVDILNHFNNKLSIVVPEFRKRDKFSLSGLDHSRLVVISDTSQKNLLKEDFVLQITGDDNMVVRKLFQEETKIRGFSKLWINSNFAPLVDLDKKHEATRLLYVGFRGNLNSAQEWEEQFPKIDWPSELKKEFPDFLAKCKLIYDENVTAKGTFQITDPMLKKIIKLCRSQYLPLIRLFINNLVEPTTNGHLLVKDLEIRIAKFIYGDYTMYAPSNLKKHLNNFLEKYHELEEIDLEGETLKVWKGFKYIHNYQKYSLLDLQRMLSNNIKL